MKPNAIEKQRQCGHGLSSVPDTVVASVVQGNGSERMRLFLLALPGCQEAASVNQLARNVKTAAPPDPYHS